MDTLTATVLLVSLIIVILVLGCLIKRFLRKKLTDINGLKGLHKKKRLQNKEISKRK